MNIEDILPKESFYTGVPDSLLKPLCNYLYESYGIGDKHIITANEGSAVALAAGYHLATGKVPIVYLQNSGLGNIVNPVTSLIHKSVYKIPCLFIIGWRGEPGTSDEPQHMFQGEITQDLLGQLDIKSTILSSETSHEDFTKAMDGLNLQLKKGQSAAILVKKGALKAKDSLIALKHDKGSYELTREKAIEAIVELSKTDVIIATTGMASRELFELREKNKQSHKYDFLTVGSMGHTSSIALGVAINKPNTKVWCIDGDGSTLMHMGAMATIGALKPKNLIHIVINNAAHDSVGGMPTIADKIDFGAIAKGCGYPHTCLIADEKSLKENLLSTKNGDELSFVEIRVRKGARKDLGRPTSTALENKEIFMKYLEDKN